MSQELFNGGVNKKENSSFAASSESPFSKVESPKAQEKEKLEIDASTVAKMMNVMSKLMENVGSQSIDYNKLSESMAKAISKANKDSDGEDALYEVEEITPEDYLEKPAMFFAYSYATVILDDVRFGKVAKCPIAPIKFKPLYRYLREDGKTVSMCMALVSSKRQAEFVRSHTRFGIQFFEEASTSKTIDASFQEKLVSAYNSISNKSEFEIQRMALQLNVKIDTSDLNEIKRRVAHKKAELMQADEDVLHKKASKIQVATGEEGDTIGNLEADIAQRFMQ